VRKKKITGANDEETKIAEKGYAIFCRLFRDYFDGSKKVGIYTEQELPLDAYGFSNPAHLDVAVVGGDRVLVADLKTGVWPYQPDGWQMRAYAVAAWDAWHPREIVLAIIQPEAEESVRTTSVDAVTLAQWASEIEAVVEASKDPNAPVRPSEQACRFCRAVGSCPAYAANPLRQAEAGLAEIDLRTTSLPEYVRAATPERRGELLESAARMSAWLDELRAELERAAADGLPVAGYEYRSARTDKVWSDETEAERLLVEWAEKHGGEAWTRKLLSPAQALKAFPTEKAELERIISAKPTKPTLVKTKGGTNGTHS
jgi:hypothetical protein